MLTSVYKDALTRALSQTVQGTRFEANFAENEAGTRLEFAL